MLAATACSIISAACGGRSSLELSWGEDAASADVSVPSLARDGAVDSAMTADVSTPMATPPSCQSGGPGLTNCGANSESCCTSLEVPGGTFYRTYTNDGSGPTDEADPATLSGFRLDKYLVTVGRFRQYVNYVTSSAGAPPANGSGIHTHLNGGQGLANGASPGTNETGWDAMDWNAYIATGASAVSMWNASLGTYCDPWCTWTNTAGSQENLPVNNVNWWEAYAFCIWDGGFLPSEAEWEYAAAGGSQEREYPWGSTDPGTGNQYAIYDLNYPGGSEIAASVWNIAPVGTAAMGAGLWGQLDLAGEMWEWNLDGYADYVDSCTDCAYLSSVSSRVIRGGFFDNYDASNLLPPNRDYDAPIYRAPDVGFRCARTP